jgi:hypothetical protein
VNEVADAARKLLAAGPADGTSSKDVADRAARACEQLSRHLARLIGDYGVTTLFRRSVALASTRFPWLSASTNIEHEHNVCAVMRDAMELQEPAVTADAFAAVLSTFIGLLKRLIGEGLVDRLLSEVWPTTFPQAAKETP